MNVPMRAIPDLGLVVHVVEMARGDRRIGDIAGAAAKGRGERLRPGLTIEAGGSIGGPGWTVAGGVDQRIIRICRLGQWSTRVLQSVCWPLPASELVGVGLALRSVFLDGKAPIARCPSATQPSVGMVVSI